MKGEPLRIEIELEPNCERRSGAHHAEMDEEQRNNDSENDEIHRIESGGSPSTETSWVVEASPASDAPSVDASKDYAVSPTKEVQQVAELELELGQYSGSDALDAEGNPTDDEFLAVTEAAQDVQTGNDPTGSSDPENINAASLEHVHGELAGQQDSFKNFIEAVREYDKLYDCYKSLKSVLELDINIFEKLKEKVDEAERNDDEESLTVLVRDTKEKFAQVLKYAPIRDAFVALHKALTNLKKQIDEVYDHR